MGSSLKYRNYFISHKLISFLRDINIRGIRKLSVLLPKILLPNPNSVGEHIHKTIHGFKLKINPTIDSGVELSIYETGTYEKGVLNFINSQLQNGDCFIDVGANIGLITIFASTKVGEAGKVLAFEANPKTFEILEDNLTLNSIKNVERYSFALGSETNQSFIYDNWQVNRGGASLVVRDEKSNSYPVDIKKLDDVLTTSHFPKIIKIDVEGFELEVLKGAKNTILKFKPILIVEISYNEHNSHIINELIDFIEGFNCYSFYKLKGTKERVSSLVQISARNEFPNHDNILCIPNLN